MRTIHLDENVDVEARLSRCMDALEDLQFEHEILKQKYDDLVELKKLHDAVYIKSLNYGYNDKRNT